MTSNARYGLSLLGSILILTTINLVQLLQIPRCCDFIYPYGFPIAFFVKGGFAGIRRFLGYGFVIDLIVLLFLALFISWGWKRIADRTSVSAARR